MGTLAQSSPTMQGLLVLASLTVISAQILPYGGLGYAGLGYNGLGYAGLAGLPYTTALPAPTVTEVEVPQYKLVPQEKVVEVAPACQNAWGFPVPCLRKKRDADDEAEAAPAAPILPLGYAGLDYAGLGYAGLGYTGLGYAGLGYNGLGYNGLPYTGSGYNGLGYAGLGYAGVGYHGLGYGLPLTKIPSLDATKDA